MTLRRLAIAFASLPLIALGGYLAFIAWLGIDSTKPSRCSGTNAYGSLTDGRRLPMRGENVRAYTAIGYHLGRTFTHSTVRGALRDSYAVLGREQPDLRFVYGESSWPWGGRFAPHKTHRNGTAVDFFVPVRTRSGEVAELPTTLANHFGYEVAFDDAGQSGELRIDFDAMASHLLALQRATEVHGIGIDLVVFDVELQKRLFASRLGPQVQSKIRFNRTPPPTRHDEHYHVEFAIPCDP